MSEVGGYKIVEKLRNTGFIWYITPFYQIGDHTFVQRFNEEWTKFLGKSTQTVMDKEAKKNVE